MSNTGSADWATSFLMGGVAASIEIIERIQSECGTKLIPFTAGDHKDLRLCYVSIPVM